MNYACRAIGRGLASRFVGGVAEREGFEPPIRLPVCRISSAVHSTTLPPLRNENLWGRVVAGPYLAATPPLNKAGLIRICRAARRRRDAAATAPSRSCGRASRDRRRAALRRRTAGPTAADIRNRR